MVDIVLACAGIFFFWTARWLVRQIVYYKRSDELSSDERRAAIVLIGLGVAATVASGGIVALVYISFYL